MKKLIASIVLGLSLVLGSGCSTFSVHNPEKIEQMNAVQKVQAGLDQTKAIVTAMVRQVTADRKLGVYNDAEWLELKLKFNQIKAGIDNIEEYIQVGNVVIAQEKLTLVNNAISYVKAELIKRNNQ